MRALIHQVGLIGMAQLLAAVCLVEAAAQQQARDLEVKVGASAREIAGGRDIQRWAVIIGISQYKYGGQDVEGTKISNLENAASDAQRIYDFLRSPEGGGFRDVNEAGRMVLLKDEQATKAKVEEALNKLRNAKPEDYFFIYIAAHGANIPVTDPRTKANTQAPHFILHDFDPRKVSDTSLLMDSFQRLVREIPAKKGMVISDTCHSAGVLLPGRSMNVETSANSRFIEEMKKIKDGGVGFIASADQFEFALETDKLGGVFTHCLLEALRGNADVAEPDGIITFREAYNYVRDKVPELTGGRQHPVYNTNNLDANRIPLSIVRYPRTGICGDPKRCGTLVIRTPDLDGVEVKLGGALLGTFDRRLERTIRLPAGDHQLIFTRGGQNQGLPVMARVEPGQSTPVEVNLSFTESDEASLFARNERQVNVYLPNDKPPRKEARDDLRAGVDLFNKQRYEDAIKRFNTAIKTNGGAYADALVYRGRSEQALGRDAQAVASLTEAIRLRPSDFETRTLLAEAKLSAGLNVKEIEAELQAVIASHPNFDYARVVYADLQLARGAQADEVHERERLFRSAEQHLRKAIAVNPNSPPARLILANVLLLTEPRTKQREAITQAEKALELFNDLANKKLTTRKALSSLSFSHLLFAGARYDDQPALCEADYLLAKALTRYADGAEGGQTDLSRARNPHLNRALATARQLRDKRRESLVLSLSSQNYMLLGQADQAIAEANKALALNPDSPAVHLLLFNAYRSTQKFRKAAAHLERFLALETLTLQERKDYEDELRQVLRDAEVNQQKR